MATGVERSAINVAAGIAVGFSQDARLMFSLWDSPNPKSLVRVWDVDTGQERFAEPFGSAEPTRVVGLSPDGQRLLIGTGTQLRIFAVGGQLLQDALTAATTVCLAPEFRQQNLGEPEADARSAFAACEHRNGRR